MENQFIKSCIEYGLKNGGVNNNAAFQIGRNKIAEDMGSDLGVTRVIARWFVEGRISKGDALELFNLRRERVIYFALQMKNCASKIQRNTGIR